MALIFTLSISLSLLVWQSDLVSANLSASRLVVIDDERSRMTGSCPSQERRDAIFQDITASLQNILLNSFLKTCGSGEWHRVASLNMSDPSQQCPSAWSEYNTEGVRACGRPGTNVGTCSATLYATNHQYSRVCGRVIGYQIGSPDAFEKTVSQPIDSYYVYGVSITHGTPRNHIWTYVAGVSEGDYGAHQHNCPCSNPNHPDNVLAQNFVGDNYYCESGNPTNTWANYRLYPDDPLWDGEQCEGECCSNGKSPWFSVELSNPTTDDIEVCICKGGEPGDDTPIQLLELYIQ